MRRIFQILIDMLAFWREKETERIETEIRIKDEARESIERIEDLADVDRDKSLQDKIKEAADKAKDLGICMLVGILLTGTAYSQIVQTGPVVNPSYGVTMHDGPTVRNIEVALVTQVMFAGNEPIAQVIQQAPTAEERIASYTLDELRAYSVELVNLVRMQGEIINTLNKQNEELIIRMKAITAEMGVVTSALNNLGATKKKSTMMHVADWTLKIVPAVLGVIAVAK